MSDRFKFRAYHKENKEMIYFDNNKAKNDIYIAAHMVELFESGEIMQCTGLKDKNGQLLFEGDILNDHVGIGIVKWNRIAAGFKVSYINDTRGKWFMDYLSDEFDTIEIIGNIHQNPELLTGKTP